MYGKQYYLGQFLAYAQFSATYYYTIDLEDNSLGAVSGAGELCNGNSYLKEDTLVGFGVREDLAHHASHAGVQPCPDDHGQHFLFSVLLIPNLRCHILTVHTVPQQLLPV